MQRMRNILSITTDIDPRLFQVNRRIKGGQWVPKEVKEAMEQLGDIACALVSPFDPVSANRFTVDMMFQFPSMRNDIDGPVKHVLDSVFRGMRRRIDHPSVNDKRVFALSAAKTIGKPRTVVIVCLLEPTQ